MRVTSKCQFHALRSHKDTNEIVSTLSGGVLGLANWLDGRGHHLNLKKTQVLFIEPRGNKGTMPPVF